MAKVTITNGPAQVTIENGDAETVGALIRLVRDELGVTNQTPFLNGEAVTEDTPVTDGDRLAFGKPVGEKGN